MRKYWYTYLMYLLLAMLIGISLNSVQVKASPPDGYGLVSNGTEIGDNARPVVPNTYFSWDNWQKESSVYYTSSIEKLTPTNGYSTHDLIHIEILNSMDGDTIAQLMSSQSGWSLKDETGQIVSGDIVKNYVSVESGGELSIDFPEIMNWQNIPAGITTTGTPWGVKSGVYKRSVGVVSNPEMVNPVHNMSGANLLAGPKVTVPAGQSMSLTFDYQYSLANIPTGYIWQRIVGGFFFQPRVIKSTFRAIDDPTVELSDQEINGTGMKMDDPVSAKAKVIDGYVFDHYEYVDQYGEKKTGTADTWTGTMDITKKGLIWWYKKAEITPTLTKMVDKSTVGLTQPLNYTLEAGNMGNTVLTNPIITDTLPKDSVQEPTNVYIESPDGTKRKIEKGVENKNTADEYYEYTADQLVIHLGITLEPNDTRKVSYTTVLTKGTNGETKVNTAILSGDNTSNEATASATVTVNNGTIQLTAPTIISFGEAVLPKSIGTNLARNPDFQLQVVDDRVIKDDFYVTAIESVMFTHEDTLSTLASPLIFKQEDSKEQLITETDSAVVFQPVVQKSDQPVTYHSTWAPNQGVMLKVPNNAKVGAYTGEITWNLNIVPD